MCAFGRFLGAVKNNSEYILDIALEVWYYDINSMPMYICIRQNL